jgi:small-conductance mechanosensitive channel
VKLTLFQPILSYTTSVYGLWTNHGCFTTRLRELTLSVTGNDFHWAVRYSPAFFHSVNPDQYTEEFKNSRRNLTTLYKRLLAQRLTEFGTYLETQTEHSWGTVIVKGPALHLFASLLALIANILYVFEHRLQVLSFQRFTMKMAYPEVRILKRKSISRD